jgi:O-glycosyl hydrolase
MRFAFAACLLSVLPFLAGCGGSSNGSGGSHLSGPATTTTLLAASPNPATSGQTVTLTATVSSSASTPTSIPSGSVTFVEGTTTLGSASLSSGTAIFTISTLSSGTHSIAATFAGDSSFSSSTSTSVAEVIGAASVATTTSLTATPNPAAAAATVTLTATVAASGATATGSVAFLDGTTTLGTVSLVNGVASYTTSTLAPATTHTLTASYAGVTGLLPSTSAAVAEVISPVGPAASTTVLAVSPNPAAAGANVTLNATVTSATGTPTGNVAFVDGTTTLSTVALNGGVASYSTTTLSAGTTHALTAVFSGTTAYAASTSPAISEVINPATAATTTTALTASPNPAAAGAVVTLNASVTSAGGMPTGNLAFRDGTTTLMTVALTNGAASYTTTALTAGSTHNLTATYLGTTAFAISTSNTVAEVISMALSASASFNFTTPNQTILGFGGAEAFYGTYLDNHPNESQIMSALYDPVKGLGITFLRLQNNYYNYNGTNLPTFDPDNVKLITAATSALGSAPTTLLSSWTPPASLKSNNSLNACTTSTNGSCTGGFGTLAQAVGGGYNYAGFGQFWLTSLQAYAAQGVVPDYISIQNEPDFPASYVGCLFNPTEAPASLYGSAQSYASYGKAFDAVYKAISTSSLASVPKMIGPEAFTVNNAQALMMETPASEVSAVAHHLYGVPSNNGNPQGNVAAETAFASAFPSQPKFETEYYQTPGFDNAIQIHNALTVANDNVYLYWGLTWPSTLTGGVSSDQAGLLYIDNPFAAQSTWAYPNGWTYNDAYYVMKGYSYFIRPGYIRYNANVTNADEDVSVYQSPDTTTTVIVLLNTSTSATDTVGLDLTGIPYSTSAIYRSSFATPINSANAERWNALGAYTASGISMPPQSEVTVVLTR